MKGSEEIYRVKLLLVGNAEQGKTSLLQCLRNNERKKNDNSKENETRTDGIEIEIWETKNKEGKLVSFSSWDFAGQEVCVEKIYFFLKVF